MIAAIDRESPAAAAKLAPGDVILDYDGKPVAQSRELPRLVAATAPGRTVKVTIWRNGKKEVVSVDVAELDPNRPTPPPKEPPKPQPPPSVEALGLKLARLTPDLRKQFSIPDGAKGVVVTEVPQNSPAATQGLHPGDLVVEVGGHPVTSPDEVKRGALAAQKSGKKNLLVRVKRDGSARFFALPVAG
jgi:serine protease Do